MQGMSFREALFSRGTRRNHKPPVQLPVRVTGLDESLTKAHTALTGSSVKGVGAVVPTDTKGRISGTLTGSSVPASQRTSSLGPRYKWGSDFMPLGVGDESVGVVGAVVPNLSGQEIKKLAVLWQEEFRAMFAAHPSNLSILELRDFIKSIADNMELKVSNYKTEKGTLTPALFAANVIQKDLCIGVFAKAAADVVEKDVKESLEELFKRLSEIRVFQQARKIGEMERSFDRSRKPIYELGAGEYIQALNYRDPRKKYLGYGAEGVVRSVIYVTYKEGEESPERNDMAMKKMGKRGPRTSNREKMSFKMEVLRVSEIMKAIDGIPGIMPIERIIEYPGKNHTIGLVMVKASSDLAQFLSLRKDIDPVKMVKLLEPIIQTVVQLHQVGIIHNDVKYENILIIKRGVCLTDFGHAFPETEKDMLGYLGLFSSSRKRVRWGTTYVPPEGITQKYGDPKAIDAWCLGVMIYKALRLKESFPIEDAKILQFFMPSEGASESPFQVVCEDLRTTKPELVPLLTILEGALNPDPVARWTALQILRAVQALPSS